jgi:drug/metabolite transporter (DMT)-like permease
MQKFLLRPTPIQALIISGFCFAIVHSSIKFLSHISVFEIVFFRSFISIAITFAVLRRAQINPWGNQHFKLILRGIVGTFAMLSYFYTLQVMPLASAVTIQYLHPIFTVLLAGVLFRESATITQWLLFGLSFVGIYLVRGFDSNIKTEHLAIAVLAAFFSACAYSLIRASRGKDHPLVVVFYYPLVSIPIVLPFAIFSWQWPALFEWPIIVIIGIFTQIAQYYMTLAYQQAAASNISNMNYLGIIYAAVIGYLAFGETVPPLAAVGMIVVALSAILSAREGSRRATQ